MESGIETDYYDLLMISPQADKPMVEWAVRLMLTRYAKNKETADEKKAELVKQAYRTLADPKRREAYDTERARQSGDRRKHSSNGEPSVEIDQYERPTDAPELDRIRVRHTATVADVVLQQKLRQGVISCLYDIVIRRPRNPELDRGEIARAVGVRHDDLEFTIWLLRERNLLRTTTQGAYTITSAGVEWAESGGIPHLSEQEGPRAVEAVKKPPAATG